MDFITIDFETATKERYSPCEIGLTFVKDNKIVETKSWLIKPKDNVFDYFNMSIHGIKPSDVENEPEFNQLWTEIKPLIENQFLIAHNASFDFSILRNTLMFYNIPFPTLNYACSYFLSKNLWEGLPSYNLKTLCKLNNITFNHHRAGSDSRATAALCLKIFEIADINSFEDIRKKLIVFIGELYLDGYKPCRTRQIYEPVKKEKQPDIIVPDSSKTNTESIFYGKKVVFTGLLSSMIRREAHQIIADIGGIIATSINSNTDFLIVGQQDYRIAGEDGMSSKQKKAIKLLEKGGHIEILSEEDFLQNI
jgi:DNA polymerase-3 subunit epsilon